MKKISALVLILCLLLCACAQPPAETQPSQTQASQPPQTQATTVQTQPPTEPATEPTTEPPVLYRNPLTGEPLDAPFDKRPFAVVINNISEALPHHGTSKAAILYEILAEGGVTRCLAVFDDISKVDTIGSIRSARTYFVSLARSYDAILAHAGDSTYANDLMWEVGMAHLDGLYNGSVFYRDQYRLSAGYALEHTLFTTGGGLKEYATQMEYDTTVEPGTEYGLNFGEDAVPEAGEPAEQITVSFLGKATTLTYNSDVGCYRGTEYGWDFTDANVDEILNFKNVFVLEVESWIGSDGEHRFATLTGEGTGYFACGGKLVPIQWHRDSETSPFTYTLEDGTPLVQGIGASYIAVIPYGGTVEYQ